AAVVLGAALSAGAVLDKRDYRHAVGLVARLTTAALTPRAAPDARLYYLARASAELAGLLALRLDRRGEQASTIRGSSRSFSADLKQVRTRPGQLLAAVVYHFRQMAVLAQVATTALGRRRLEAYRAKMRGHLEGLLKKLEGPAALKVAALGVCRMADVWAAALIKPGQGDRRLDLEQEEARVKTLVMDIHRLSADEFVHRAMLSAYRFIRLASLALDGSLAESFDRMELLRRKNPFGPGRQGAVKAYQFVYRAIYLLAVRMAQ
ncbi:MAG: hypothetical protein KKC37_13795, partial [Proteobacteria bacterium]|nr:hypothetical protein [Pseudomonadota bacterium]